MPTVADYLVQSLKDAGVQYLFGVPGGGSNIDIIEAAGKADLPFVLTQTEVAAAFMASAQAEALGKPGACLTTLGPGAASVTNGVANAYLERIPLLVFSDVHPESIRAVMQHQTISHSDIFSGICKWTSEIRSTDVAHTLMQALTTATQLPQGPVHLDISADVTKAKYKMLEPAVIPVQSEFVTDLAVTKLSPALEKLLKEARRPLVLIGLGARSFGAAAAIRQLCEEYNIPALVTYKAKGVIPDVHRCFAGVLTNGALERPILEQADLFIAIGLDPVELLPKEWDYPQPLISCSSWGIEQKQLPVTTELVGDIAQHLTLLGSNLAIKNGWDFYKLSQEVQTQLEAMRPEGKSGALLPHRVVVLVAKSFPNERVTVDAGAHMFPVMALWRANYPNNVLISNGLATMSFALPAAIGLALLDRTKAVVAFTGDGGLQMCLAELRTAVRENLRIRVVVFDDAELSLIKIKQLQRGYAPTGVQMGQLDWEMLGTALGLVAKTATTEAELLQVLADTADCNGPVLIAAKIDPTPYQAMINALRG